jgi:hypothetical protein
MAEIEQPQTPEVRIRLSKAAYEAGFSLRLSEDAGWAAYASTTLPGSLWLAAGTLRGPCFVALDRPAVAAAWGPPPAPVPGPGSHRFTFADFAALTEALTTLWPLLRDLPDDPLTAYAAQTANLIGDTETVRLAKQRIGQDIFRARLIADWHCRCPLTGITDPALLRASHIIPWADCATDAERLDPANGLLLSALWDAAFDAGLVTFADDGAPILSPHLSTAARAALDLTARVPLSAAHRHRMTYHRTWVFKEN